MELRKIQVRGSLPSRTENAGRLAKRKDRTDKQAELLYELDRLQTGDKSRETAPFEETAGYPDDRLRLIFTCCHPSLSVEAQVALTLRTWED